MKIFVAGASGALGRPLITQLREAGHEVWGMAHRPESLNALEQLGAHGVKGDALDREAMFRLIEQIRPEAVIDQLTSLPLSPFDLPQRLPADRKLRLEGGGHLLAAAQANGVQRYVQQSCGFYLDGEGKLATETSPLKINAPGTIRDSAHMYMALEKRVLGATSMEGVALRYGFFYGPGTWYWPDGAFSQHVARGEVSLLGEGRGVFSFIHVEDAAQATVAALTAPAGVYNVVDSAPTKISEWLPAYAKWVQAAPPPYLNMREALEMLGEEGVYYQNELSGASNRKAIEVLGLRPRRLAWLG